MGVHFAPPSTAIVPETLQVLLAGFFIRCEVAFFRGMDFVVQDVHLPLQERGLVRSPQA